MQPSSAEPELNVEADLHIHTTGSDGRYTPAECVAKATSLGLRAIAVTDHDTMAAVDAARDAAPAELMVIPGIEFGCHWENRTDVEVHILGYGCDASHPQFAAELLTLRDARVGRAAAMVRKLSSLGLELTIGDVMKYAGDGTVGRPHVAQALLARGHVGSVADAFARYLSPGRPGYVEHYRPSPLRAIELILASGGVPVLAHPGLIDNRGIVTELIRQGLLGLEVWHPQHTPEDSRHYSQLAGQRGLLATGGSDFHGIGREGAALGSCGVSFVRATELLAVIAASWR